MQYKCRKRPHLLHIKHMLLSQIRAQKQWMKEYPIKEYESKVN